MNIVQVKLIRHPYPVYIDVSLEGLGTALKIIQSNGFNKTLVITHPFLKKRYGKAIEAGMNRAKLQWQMVTIPEGESKKNLKTIEKLYQTCLKYKLDRTSCVMAFGGGVLGDMSGFLAATYLRGISYIQVPTTLLAMVDSSIGGKTGVDLPESKNSVGAFHQPRLVWMDCSTLKTLPESELRNGMAEVIKYGIIADKNLFELLEKEAPVTLKNRHLSAIITRCAKIKADVVAKDEMETRGLREILNFGHTIGHAIETATNYRAYKHGEAVAIGMIAAGSISRNLGLWIPEELNRLIHLIKQSRLPIRMKKPIPLEKLTAALYRDKKVQNSELRFVLPTQIGKVIVKKISVEEAVKGLEPIQP